MRKKSRSKVFYCDSLPMSYSSGELFHIFGAELLESVLLYCLSYILHKMIVEIQVVKNTKAHAEHFLCFEKVAYIRPRIISARRAAAAAVYRRRICFILLIQQIHCTVAGEYERVPRIS